MTKNKALQALRTAAYGCGDSMMSSEDEMLAREWGRAIHRDIHDDEIPVIGDPTGTRGNPGGAYGKYERHENSPPAGADGSPQRKKYNDWYRKNVCPEKGGCGAPWLAKSATEELYARAGLKTAGFKAKTPKADHAIEKVYAIAAKEYVKDLYKHLGSNRQAFLDAWYATLPGKSGSFEDWVAKQFSGLTFHTWAYVSDNVTKELNGWLSSNTFRL